ncbi:MAG: hypothetical protein ABSC94_16735 [Polyangiaceae bacterium]|jgi:hypothetical protein
MLRPSATRGGYDGRALRTPLVRSLRLLTPSLARAADGGLSPDRRREVRRGLHFGCRVLCADGLKLVADRGLDLSPEGVLVLSDERVVCGAKLVVSFMATDFANGSTRPPRWRELRKAGVPATRAGLSACTFNRCPHCHD